MKAEEKRTFLVSGIQVPLETNEGDVCFSAKKVLRRAGICPADAVCHIFRKSVDARKKDAVRFVYTVAVTGSFSQKEVDAVLSGRWKGIALCKSGSPTPLIGEKPTEHRPLVVGTGPAGLFCALMLAENGYRPLVIERGGSVEERKVAISRFETTRELDTETNVQFGAGGAGTFSDGKLMTRVNDPLNTYVLETFCQYGAPPSICVDARPHIGTDVLCDVVERMIARIEQLGGEVRFHTRLDDLIWQGTKLIGIKTSQGDIPCDVLVLATGHSARDTYRMLMRYPFMVEPKPFSVGVRVEHLREDIDRAMYGAFAGHPALGAAEYHLSYDTAHRGVYSFCMCPGGYVMASASEEDTVVVNGMSRQARDGRNSNSAIAVSVFREDYGATPEGAIAFQQKIESDAFLAGGGDYAVPLTTMGDFLLDSEGTEPTRITPTYMAGNAYRLSKTEAYLPQFVVDALRGGIAHFERNISGFTVRDALLSGAETRTSAPVRLVRDSKTKQAVGVSQLYPCGEGAGYAGGITSAALDGIHTALAIMRTYRPL